MAIFGSKNKKQEKVSKPKEKVAKDVKVEAPKIISSEKAGEKNLSKILRNPRITEKASMLSAQNVYTFDVDQKSNKKTIERAIKEIYQVNPEKIRIINQKNKSVWAKGKLGEKSRGKKAYIFLKEGDKIDTI